MNIRILVRNWEDLGDLVFRGNDQISYFGFINKKAFLIHNQFTHFPVFCGILVNLKANEPKILF